MTTEALLGRSTRTELARTDDAARKARADRIVERWLTNPAAVHAVERRMAALLVDPERAAQENMARITRVLLRGLGPEGEIDDAYDRIADLEQQPQTAETQAEIRAALARLRELQHAEAERMRRHFERSSSFDPARARKALDEARKLIRRHARPS